MSLIRLCVIVLATALMSACQTNSVVLSDRELVDAAATSPEKPEYEEFVIAGQALPIQSVVDVNGETVDLTATDKRKLVILFATWCSDSNRALKALNQSELLNDDSIEIIAIAREETAETVIAWRDKHAIMTPLAADPDRSIYKMFAAAGVPRFITVSTDNKVIKMNLAEGEDQLSLIEWQ
ncbi:TlpA family protein disulfide reductase [Pseudomonadota bacterium]